MKLIKTLIIIAILFSTIKAQELFCSINVDFANLPVTQRKLLVEFKTTVEDFMNNQSFADEFWEGNKIHCNLKIFFLSGKVRYP